MNKRFFYSTKHTMFLIVFMLITKHASIISFADISQVIEYAQQHDEYPAIENNNPLDPNYEQFYKNHKPGHIKSFAQYLGLLKKDTWSVEEFKKTLEYITIQRENNAYQGRFVEKIIPAPESTILILSDVHGAFHSLARDIQEFVRQGFIDSQFKIIKENTYLVFNGNVIDLSPYILETLTLVLDLMRANPNKVFYLKGQHEDKEYWYNFGLKQELALRAAHLSSEKIPLNSLINRFFNTLPLALYLVAKDRDKTDVVRISPQGRKKSEIREEDFDDFFEHTEKQPDIYKLINKQPEKTPFTIRAIIKKEERSINYTPTRGLIALEPDQGSTAWATFSSPTKVHQSLYEFFYDTFTIIKTTPTINNWTISLYNRDVRELQGFARVATFNLVTGQEIVQKYQSTTPTQAPPTAVKSDTGDIIFASSLDFSRGLRVESKLAVIGFNLAIDRANRTGGIHGRKIKLVTLDDEYNPEKARANVELFKKKYDINMIFSPMGDTPLEGYMDLIKEKNMLVVFPITGAVTLRDQNIPYLIHFRPSYDAIYTTLLRYAREQLNAKRFAIAYELDLSSVGILDQIKRAGISQNDYIGVPYDPTITSFKEQADAIKTFNPDAIVFLGLSRNTEQLIDAIGIENILGKQLLGDELADTAFIKFLGDRGLTHQYTDAQNIPNPTTSMLDILREYREDLGNKEAIEPCSAETYVSTSIFIDALRRIKGPITNEAIINILEHTKNYNFKGIELNFNPVTRELSQNIWLNTGKPEWVKIELAQPVSTDKQKSISSEKVAPATQSTSEIVVGATLDLSKALSIQGKETYFGMTKAIEKANRDGGVKGKTIRLIALDDEDNPTIARNNVETLITQHSTRFILSPLQATSIKGYLDLIRNAEILLLFPCTGSTVLEDSSLKNLITIRAWYTDTDILALLYPRKAWGVKRTAFFASNDELNTDLEKHLQSTKVPPQDYKIFFHDPTLLDLTEIKNNILAYQPNIIILYSSIQASIELLRQIGSESLLGIKLLAEEFNSELFRDFIESKGLKKQYYDVENLPNPATSNLPIVAEYRKEIGDKTPNSFSLEGYVNASLFVELARMTQGEITIETVLKTAQGLKDYNFKGLVLTYNNRQLFNKIWLDEGEPDWKLIDVAELIKSS